MHTYPRTGSLTIADGENVVIAAAGDFFRVLAGVGAVVVEFDDDGQSIKMESGLSVHRITPFTQVRLTNESGAAINGLLVAVGYGNVEDNRLQYSGGVVIAGTVTIDGAVSVKIASDLTASAVSVGTSATLIAAADASRKSLVLQNLGSDDVYIGGASVTTAGGLKLAKNGGALTIDKTSAAVYGVSATAGMDVRTLVEA